MAPVISSESAQPPGVGLSTAIFEVAQVAQRQVYDPSLKALDQGNLQYGVEHPMSEPLPVSTEPDPATSTDTPATSTATSASAMRTGIIAGVVVGGFVILALAALLVFLYMRRRRHRRAPSSEFLGKEHAPFRRMLSFEKTTEPSLGIPPLAYNSGRSFQKSNSRW